MISAIAFFGMCNIASAVEAYAPSRGHATNPKWSKDGSKVAFELNELSGKIDLMVTSIGDGLTAGSTKQIRLNVGSSRFGGSGGMATSSPVWHPKGYLLFSGSYTGGSNRIYMSNLTSPPQQIVSDATISGDLSWPSLSEDGNTLLFASDATGKGDVYSYGIRNRQLTQLISSKHSEMAPRFDATNQVAYTRKLGSGEDLFVLNEGKSTRWAKGSGDQTRPNWAGSSVVYFTNERSNGSWDVAVTAEGQRRKFLAKSVRLPFRAPPALSPDKKWVAYGHENPKKSSRIWFTRIDGSKTKSYRTGLVAAGEPNLVEKNGRVYLSFTALPAQGSDWRRLHVADVTDLLR